VRSFNWTGTKDEYRFFGIDELCCLGKFTFLYSFNIGIWRPFF
jgi:hypothetical protein